MNSKKNGLLLIISLAAFLSSCNRENPSQIISLQRQFNLPIGKMEDQIDLIQLPGEPFRQTIDMVMKRGLFYIGNGAAHKVMEFSSYGDLLALYYNPAENPSPILLKEDSKEGSVSNRKAFSYPFINIGQLGVTETSMLLIVDEVPADREIWDEETGTLLRNVILRFDPEGVLINYIGQEGIGGTPFPYIEAMEVTLADNVTLVTRTMAQWIVYSFDAEGNKLAEYVLDEDILPSAGEGTIMSLDAVIPGQDSDIIFVKTDYYKNQIEQENAQDADYRFHMSSVHWIDIGTGELGGTVELPPALRTSGVSQLFNKEEEEAIQYLLGVSAGGFLFLLSPSAENIYNLALVDLSGMVVHRGEIILEDDDTMYRTFYVSADGILSAFIGGKLGAEVVLWRTDRYLGKEE
ncbi:MAG: hypothetical protein HN368_08585 [Spirochaetales bacterium]|nr:hypothetical protein [Spirochaetales bacterium]